MPLHLTSSDYYELATKSLLLQKILSVLARWIKKKKMLRNWDHQNDRLLIVVLSRAKQLSLSELFIFYRGNSIEVNFKTVASDQNKWDSVKEIASGLQLIWSTTWYVTGEDVGKRQSLGLSTQPWLIRAVRTQRNLISPLSFLRYSLSCLVQIRWKYRRTTSLLKTNMGIQTLKTSTLYIGIYRPDKQKTKRKIHHSLMHTHLRNILWRLFIPYATFYKLRTSNA